MLKTGEAAGPDEITIFCIDIGFQHKRRYVFNLFKLCFAEHIVPGF